MSRPRVRIGAASDVGLVRDHNEDRFHTGDNYAIVADGMGGHAAGEVAAQIAVDRAALLGPVAAVHDLEQALLAANREVFAEADDPDRRGMGTTAVAAVVDAARAEAAILNIGDSRAYLVRDGALSQVSEDHSLVGELVRQGRLLPEQARVHPQRNVVTRVLGIEAETEVDIFGINLRDGDRLLLCSDGLTDELDDDEIVALLDGHPVASEAATALVAAARGAGGRDNITVAVLDVLGVAADVAPSTFVGELTDPPPTDPAPARPIDRPSVDDSRRAPVLRTVVGIVGWLLPLVVIAGLGYAGLRWYATSAWFVADDDGVVTIFRGRPEGVLWFEPEVVERSDLATEDLVPAEQERLAQRTTLGSREEADRLVETLEANSSSAQAAAGGG